MIQETNFNDIRRNFILASILLILFLLYGTEIKIEQLLIFKFDIEGDWAIISPYFDILLILLLFFLYTLARYGIYAIDEIRKYQYKRIALLELLRNLGNNANSKDIVESFFQSKTNYSSEVELSKINEYSDINIKLNEEGSRVYFSFFVYNGNSQLIGERYLIPEDGNNILTFRNGFSFEPIKLTFKNVDIWKKYGGSISPLFLKKEFSDYWWPLFLIIPIFLILIFKLVNFLICF